MPKGEVEIKEGGQLMDPAGKEFQEMLAKAQTAAVEQLAKAPDTSMVEGEKDGKPAPKVEAKPASSAAPAKEEDETDGTEDIPGDDIGNLKHKVSGLQAELARVRKQKSGSAEEAQVLKERIADMEGQMKVLREGKTTSSVEDRLAKLSDEQVADNKIAWEDEMADARVIARLAEKDGDTVAVKEANQRIVDARSALKLYANEERRRIQAEASKTTNERDEHQGMATEVESLFTDLYKAAPDLKDQESDIWKAGQAEFSKLPRLMKALGPLGELVAVANAIAKNPTLIGKKVITSETGKVINAIETAADKAFQRGGSAPSSGTIVPVTTIKSQSDLIAFEERVRAVKGG